MTPEIVPDTEEVKVKGVEPAQTAWDPTILPAVI